MDSYQLASIVFFAGHIVVTIKAFQDEMWSGIMCLILPFYLPYYALRHMNFSGKGLFLLVYFGCAGYGVWGEYRPLAPDPCALVTKADAQEFLGESVGDPLTRSMNTSIGFLKACVYASAQDRRKNMGIVVSGDCPQLPAAVREMRVSTALASVADEAFYRAGGVYARKGKVCVVIMSEGRSDSMGAVVASERLVAKVFVRLTGKRR